MKKSNTVRTAFLLPAAFSFILSSVPGRVL
jgi:hypothetical protein